MKGTIVIYVLPNEVIDMKDLSDRLLKSFKYIDEPHREWRLHVILSVSDENVDWQKSTVSKDWVIDKFREISEDWEYPNKFEVRDDILGSSDARRVAIKENSDTDYFIWLEPDIIFDPVTLYYTDVVIRIIEENYDTPYFVITPETVRLNDKSWDCIVNERFKDKPLDYQKNNNPYVDTAWDGGSVSVEEVNNDYPGHPRFKFAGGWFVCYSGKLLRHIGIPDSLGPYGIEDTWLMHAMEKLTVQGRGDFKQFKINNIIVGENYLYRNDNKINGISLIDRRDEFRKKSQRQANLALQDL